MRCLYFACASLSLFLCDHAQARIGETYEESVKRYEKAGFTKERTTVQVPPDDKNLGYFKLVSEDADGSVAQTRISRQGVSELTWTNKDPKGDDIIHVVSIRQMFYGEWPPTKDPKPWEGVLRCFDITYTFRDHVANPSMSPEMKTWVLNLLKKELGISQNDPIGGYPHAPADFKWTRSNLFSYRGDHGVGGMFHNEGKVLNIGCGKDNWKEYFGIAWRGDPDIKASVCEAITQSYKAWKDNEELKMRVKNRDRKADEQWQKQRRQIELRKESVIQQFDKSGL